MCWSKQQRPERSNLDSVMLLHQKTTVVELFFFFINTTVFAQISFSNPVCLCVFVLGYKPLFETLEKWFELLINTLTVIGLTSFSCSFPVDFSMHSIHWLLSRWLLCSLRRFQRICMLFAGKRSLHCLAVEGKRLDCAWRARWGCLEKAWWISCDSVVKWIY